MKSSQWNIKYLQGVLTSQYLLTNPIHKHEIFKFNISAEKYYDGKQYIHNPFNFIYPYLSFAKTEYNRNINRFAIFSVVFATNDNSKYQINHHLSWWRAWCLARQKFEKNRLHFEYFHIHYPYSVFNHIPNFINSLFPLNIEIRDDEWYRIVCTVIKRSFWLFGGILKRIQLAKSSLSSHFPLNGAFPYPHSMFCLHFVPESVYIYLSNIKITQRCHSHQK